MKKTLLTISVVVALVLSSSAMAGDTKLSVGLGGQLGMPMADFGDAWEMGFGGCGRIGLEVSPQLEVGLTLSYGSLGLDTDGLINASFGALAELLEGAGATFTSEAEGGDITIFGVHSDIRFFIPVGAENAPFRPYLTASGGLTSLSIDEFTCLAEAEFEDVTIFEAAILGRSESKSAASFGAGAGFEYMFSPTVGFWADAQYILTTVKIQIPAISATTFREYTIEYTVGYLPVRAGVKFMFGGK